MKEWNYEKNSISPEEITAGSKKKVWWKCQTCGYEWQASIGSRTSGRGCPNCKGGRKRQILCIETNKKYESIAFAALCTNINRNSLNACCHGKQKTAGGYHWKFVD